MLGLNLSQWNDLTVVDQERLHDLLAQPRVEPREDIGLDMARRLAREAGVWTVVLGDFTQAGDSLHLVGPGVRCRQRRPGRRRPGGRPERGGRAPAVRPARRQAARPLRRADRGPDRAGPLHHPVARGVPGLPRGRGPAQPLGPGRRGAGARAAPLAIDTTFGLAYYKLALTRGWLVGTEDSIADRAIVRATAHSSTPAGARPDRHQRLPRVHRRPVHRGAGPLPAAPGPRHRRRRRVVRPGRGMVPRHHRRRTRRRPGPRRSAPSASALALDPEYALAYDHVQHMLGDRGGARGRRYALVATRLVRPRPPQPTAGRWWTARRCRPRCAGPGRRGSPRPATGSPPSRPRSGPTGRWWTRTSRRATTTRRWAKWTGSGRHSPVHPELPFVEARIRFASGDVDRAAAAAPHGARHRGAAGFPAVPGHADGGERHRRGGQRLRLPGRPRQRRQGARPRRPGPPRGGEAPGRRRGQPVGRELAPGGAGRAVRRRWASRRPRCGRCGRARPRPAGWRAGRAGAPGAQRRLGGDRPLHRPERPTARRSSEYRAHDRRPAVAGGPGAAGAEPGRLDRAPGGCWPSPTRVGGRCRSGRTASTAGRSRRRPTSSWATTRPTLRVLRDFEPAALRTGGFDSRWGMLGRVRLLRAAAYEQLGRRAEAREEYRQVLAQWKGGRRGARSRSSAGGAGAGAAGGGVGLSVHPDRAEWPRHLARLAIFPATLAERDGRGASARPSRGKSELHRADCQVTPGRRKATDRATESRPPGRPSREGWQGKGETVG